MLVPRLIAGGYLSAATSMLLAPCASIHVVIPNCFVACQGNGVSSENRPPGTSESSYSARSKNQQAVPNFWFSEMPLTQVPHICTQASDILDWLHIEIYYSFNFKGPFNEWKQSLRISNVCMEIILLNRNCRDTLWWMWPKIFKEVKFAQTQNDSQQYQALWL